MKTLKSPPHESLVIPHTPAGDLTAGDVVAYGGGIAFSLNTTATGAKGGLVVGGRVEVTKDAGAAWTDGQRIYYDSGDSNFTTTIAGNTLAGFAVGAVASAAVIGLIQLYIPPGTAGV